MILLEPHADGIIVKIRAQAGARKSGVQGQHDGALKVAVTQAPEKGKANKAIIAVLSKQLDVRKSQIELISGQTSPQKKFLFRDITAAELSSRLVKVVGAK